MPLGIFEADVLRLLVRNRHPDSFVAGATILHKEASSPRTSQDIDIFHDTAEAIITAVEADTKILRKHHLDASGYPQTPDPDQNEFKKLTRHHGRLRGAWPTLGR